MGGKEAEKAAKRAARSQNEERLQKEDELKIQREKAQQLFMRNLRAQFGIGLFGESRKQF